MVEGATPGWVWVCVAGYVLVSLGLLPYGLHAYLMAGMHRSVGRRVPPPPAAGSLPRVTVQLPLYNERYVAGRLLDAAAALAYPRDRLQIQVLDDSSDDTVSTVAELVRRKREEGLDIVHRRRTRRTGYKGGALREGLAEATGSLIAVFDADFVPSPDFLERTVPFFADPGVGMVQTRWTHLNEAYSTLTRCQAAALDGHFLIEHTVRNRSGAFINFNGTAGIWRKGCILDAGNWQDDTLTEDLDLSYRAQLRGWKFLFLPEVTCPAELPAEVNGLKGQQFRWAKGSAQTALKMLPSLARARLSAFARFEAFIHLTHHAVYPLLLALGLASVPALWIVDQYPRTAPFFGMSTLLIMASYGHPWLYFAARRVLGKPRGETLALIPVMVAGNLGLALNNSRALIEALSGKESPFHRTPKYGVLSREDGWQGKVYRAPAGLWACFELMLAAYLAAGLVLAFQTGRFLALPFLVLYVGGTATMGGASLWNAFVRWKENVPVAAGSLAAGSVAATASQGEAG